MSTGLVLWDSARTAIEQARSIDEVKDIRDRAEALRLYAKQAGETLEVQNSVAEIKIRAERRAGELLKDMDKAQGRRTDLLTSSQPVTMLGQPPTLSEVGITRMQSSRWQRMAEIPEPEFEEHIARTKAANEELTSASVQRFAKDLERQERRAEILEAAAERPLDPPAPPYGLIYADPPWRYEHVKTESRAIENQYPTMALEDICALPVSGVTDNDCVLFLWATNPKLEEAIQVINAWGFTYRTNMVWVKDKIGMGYYARQQHELLLIATKGQPGAPMPEDRQSSVIEAPRTEHSKKPLEFYDLLERLYPAAKKVELFARNTRDGWAVWGNQI